MTKPVKPPKAGHQASDDAANTTEDVGMSIDVLANDGNNVSLYSVDQQNPFTLQTVAQSALGASIEIVNGHVFYSATGSAAIEALAEGETATDSFSYSVADKNGKVSFATVHVTLTGANDAPAVSGPVSALVREGDAPSTLDALANASDVDHGASLSVVGVPTVLPAGVTYDAPTHSFTFNPADGAYQDLGSGDSTIVTVDYGVTDGLATTQAAVSWTVTGVNDTGRIERVSIGFDGEANAESGAFGGALPAVFGTGDRYVAFYSSASNLVADDTNGHIDIFIYDRVDGTTERIPADLQVAGTGQLSVTDDGTQIAYGDLFRGTVVVYDRTAHTSEVIPTGFAPGVDLPLALISGDGRDVVFTTHAALAGDDTNGASDTYIYHRESGMLERVLGNGGVQPNGDSIPGSISGDGRYIALYSTASNLVDGDSNGGTDAFVYDQATHSIERVSVGLGAAQANGASSLPVITHDGRYVAFASTATNLVDNDTNGHSDIFVYDRLNATTERVSVTGDGTQLNGESNQPSISADGRFVAFHSNASTGGDTNGAFDVFVFDRGAQELARISDAPNGSPGNGNSAFASISADGQELAFVSLASNLVADDHNGVGDVFVANLAQPWSDFHLL